MARRSPTFEEVFTEAGIIPQWIERGRVEGRTEGRVEGRVEGLEQVARNALAEGFPVNVVQKITGLDMETIQKLQAK